MRRAPKPGLEELAKGIFAYLQPPGTWCLSNSAFLVGPDAVTLVDTTSTERRARWLRGAIESVTPLTPRTVINTHHHGDHTYGNGVFKDAVFIGHDNCPAEVIEQGMLLKHLWTDVQWGNVEIIPPTVTFADRLTMYVGDLRLELIHPGPAHTTTDVIIWIPERRILIAGDIVFNGGTPFVAMGSIAGSLSALKLLRGLDPEIVLSGHGPVGDAGLFDQTESYLRWIQDLAKEGIASGLSPLAVARETALGEYGDWTDPERIVGNLHRAYAEERGEPLGVKLDTPAIFMEMIEFNGGQVPTCLA